MASRITRTLSGGLAAAAIAGMGFVTTTVSGHNLPTAAAADCRQLTPGDFQWSLTDTSSKLADADKTDPGSGTWGYPDNITANFVTTTSLSGVCDSATETYTLPADMANIPSRTDNITDTDGNVIGTVTWDGTKKTATITMSSTLSDYAVSHTNITAKGFVSGALAPTLNPGTDNNETFTSGGQTQTVDVKARNPTGPGFPNTTTTAKFGNDAGNGTGTATIKTGEVLKAGQTITVTDTLTSPAQTINCAGTFKVTGYTSVDNWHRPVDSPLPAADWKVTSCTATTMTMSVTSTVDAQAFLVTVPLNLSYVNGTTQWTDDATQTVAGTSTINHTNAVIPKATSGASGAADGLVSIGDDVWANNSRSGTQTSGEPAMPNVTVDLLDSKGNQLATTTTDSNGHYSFTGLTPSTDYQVKFEAPIGWAFTTQNTGTDTSIDSNPNPSTGIATVHTPASGKDLATTPDDATIDAGLVKYNLSLTKKLTSTGPFKPGDTVTYTLTPHNDGPSDALAGWSVTDIIPAGMTIQSMSGTGYTCDTGTATCTNASALAAGQDAAPITVTATINADVKAGATEHNVAYVAPSSKDVTETNPLGTPPVTGTDTDKTSTDNDSQAPLTVNGYTPGISVVKGDAAGNAADTAADAVDLNGANSVNIKYAITNTGDEPLKNVKLADEVDANGTVSTPTCTWPDGSTGPTWAGPMAVGAVVNCTSTVTGINAGATHEDTATVTAAGNIDGTPVTDHNSYYAHTEAYNLSLVKKLTSTGPVFAGSTVTYTLTPHNDGPNDAVAGWSVTDVPGAGLKVQAMTGDGYDCDTASDTCTASGKLAANSDGSVITVTAVVTDDAQAGSTLHNVAYVAPSKDQGYPETNPLGTPPTGTTDTSKTPTDNDSQADIPMGAASVSVGDTVWDNTQHDGLQHTGDKGIPGVQLTITGPDGKPVTDVKGNPVAAQTTDTNGHYEFTGLPALPGGQHYTVSVDSNTVPAGYLPTVANVGGDRTVDSSTGSATSTDLTTNGASDQSLDFGYWKPAPAITIDKVDAKGNEGDTTPVDLGTSPGSTKLVMPVKNTGDEALKNINVSDAVTGSGTVSNFSCDFSQLGGPSTGTVWVGPMKPGDTFTCTADLSNVTTTEHSDVASVTATGADSNTPVKSSNPYHAITSKVPTVSVGNRVWYDANHNGIQDAGEKGIAGVTVDLLNPAGKQIGVTRTDAQGIYQFTGLPVIGATQHYTTKVVAPAGYQPTVANVGNDRAVDSSTGTSSSVLPLTTDGASDETLDYGFWKPVTLTETVQLDRYMPVIAGTSKAAKAATAANEKLVASLDDDGFLKYREDMGSVTSKATSMWDHTQHAFVTVQFTQDASAKAPTDAQLIAAVNAKAPAGFHVTTTAKTATVTGTVTEAWVLNPTATTVLPWGASHNLAQRFLARS